MKVTLITGASGGLGEEFARQLAAKKHNLVLVARSEDKLAKLCDELMLKHKIMAHYVAMDLCDYEADARLFAETEKHSLEVDWLINNAGFGQMGEFLDLDLEKQLEMVGLNVMALVALTHRYGRQMRERGRGTIINVASTAAFQPIPFFGIYAATKAFVSSFSEALAAELKPHGVGVTTLCPGPTETNFFAAGGIDQNIIGKSMQTSAEVVKFGINAAENRKVRVVSGIINKIISYGSVVTPNRLSSTLMANILGPKFRKK